MKGKLKIEVSPSGRAGCVQCGKAILKGHLRILEIYHGRYTIKDKYCASCGITLISDTIKELQDMIKQVEEVEKNGIKTADSEEE